MMSSSSDSADVALLITGNLILKLDPSSLGGETGLLVEGVCQDGVGETDRGCGKAFLWFCTMVLF